MEYNTPLLGIKVILKTIKGIYLGARDGHLSGSGFTLGFDKGIQSSD